MTEEIVKSALSKVTYPGFTKDIVAFGFVKEIKIEGKNVNVTVDITSSAPEVAHQITTEATDELKACRCSRSSYQCSSTKNAKRELFKG